MRLRDTLKQLARPSGVLVFSALGPGLGSIVALGLAYANAEALRDSGLGLAVVFLIVGGVACGLTLLPTHALSLVSGWAFGLPVGLAVAFGGALLGTPVGYRAGSWLSGPGVAAVVTRHRRASAILETIRAAPPGKASFLVALLRMSPIVPYGTTNVLAAVLGVPLRALVLGTLLGHAPRAGVVVALGAGLESLDAEKSTNPWFWAAGLCATAVAIVLMGVVAKRALQRAARLPALDPTPEQA